MHLAAKNFTLQSLFRETAMCAKYINMTGYFTLLQYTSAKVWVLGNILGRIQTSANRVQTPGLYTRQVSNP